jgi:8-oxo-dGTP pyrophosphatase MutT (NUDIX family)
MSMISENCVFNCGFCIPGKAHVCRKCGAINSHRSSDCSNIEKYACVFDCGFCTAGRAHVCYKCKMTNDHRSSDCPFVEETKYEEIECEELKCDKDNDNDKDEFIDHLSDLDEIEPDKVDVCGAIVIKKINDKWYVLIQQRSLNLGGFKILPGGKKEPYETSIEGGLRELYEEASLKQKGLNYVCKLITTTKVGKVICNTVFIANDDVPLKWGNYGIGYSEIRDFQFEKNGEEIHACEGHAWVHLKFLMSKKSKQYIGAHAIFQKFLKISNYL